MQRNIQDLSHLGTILAFMIAALGFLSISLIASRLLRRQKPNAIKLSTYESGEEAVGPAWAQFNIRFYAVALLFLLFDVELAFLFPWAIVYKNEEMMKLTNGAWSYQLFYEALVFIGVLALGLGFAWANGFLDWVRPIVKPIASESPVPMQNYADFNKGVDVVTAKGK
jgi:NADH-quinone oxidoreductase subunit A